MLCMFELCVCVGGTRGFRVVSKCARVSMVFCAWLVLVHGWLQCRENALERPCVLVRVCGVHACANMGDCEVAREKDVSTRQGLAT